MAHKEINGQLMLQIYVRPELAAALGDGEPCAIEAKKRFARELYSDIRQLISEYKELGEAVTYGYDQKDDRYEMNVAFDRITLCQELLRLLGFNPECDPELGWKGLRF